LTNVIYSGLFIKACYNSGPMSELDFINNGPESFDSYESIFQELMERVFNHLSVSENYIIDVNIVNNEFIHNVNKEYRGVDRPTDVISFAFEDDENEKNLVGDFPKSLGSIIISYEKAEEQAKEYGHSLLREMSFLFVHGTLHLLGYDHMKPEDEKVMFALQDEILGERK